MDDESNTVVPKITIHEDTIPPAFEVSNVVSNTTNSNNPADNNETSTQGTANKHVVHNPPSTDLRSTIVNKNLNKNSKDRYPKDNRTANNFNNSIKSTPALKTLNRNLKITSTFSCLSVFSIGHSMEFSSFEIKLYKFHLNKSCSQHYGYWYCVACLDTFNSIVSDPPTGWSTKLKRNILNFVMRIQ